MFGCGLVTLSLDFAQQLRFFCFTRASFRSAAFSRRRQSDYAGTSDSSVKGRLACGFLSQKKLLQLEQPAQSLGHERVDICGIEGAVR